MAGEGKCRTFGKYVFNSLFVEYKTEKTIKMETKSIAIFTSILRIIVILYIGVFVLGIQKKYQQEGGIESDIAIKSKGVSSTNFTSDQFNKKIPIDFLHMYNRIWDSTDVVQPPEAEAFFVMTNVVITPNQTLSTCGESPNIMRARCTKDSDCEKGLIFRRGSGALTGKCIAADQVPDSDPILDAPIGPNKTIKVCQVAGWCPLELNITSPLKDDKALLASAENYKVTIKNTISFPSFGDQYTRTNMQRNVTENYLHNCTFNETTDLFCPVFRIGDIVRGAGLNFSTVSLKGAIISIGIRWYCNLDLDIDMYCIPKYSFQSLSDDDELASKSPGWNFRHATYHEYNRRTLFKAYGIKFVIDVQGQGRQFQFYPMFVAIGSGLGFMKFIPFASNGLLSCLSNNFRKEQNELIPSDEDTFKQTISRLCCCCCNKKKEKKSEGETVPLDISNTDYGAIDT